MDEWTDALKFCKKRIWKHCVPNIVGRGKTGKSPQKK
jgi:hypothetical protein